ncbi:Ig-like domain-containing protein [Flexithrix dorotheae]|uniref:Ig-like domain-containing protein n=1 Tax=Flexithrix dorotheae TaxID=70993 RepID=UPI00036F22CB|nr:Ig-like domain-containing protein [Flexithrix dorotheae]
MQRTFTSSFPQGPKRSFPGHGFLWILPFFLLLAGCDNFVEDDLADNSKILTVPEGEDDILILPNEATAINILDKKNLNAGASISIVTPPEKGTAELLKNGFIIYSPDSTFLEGIDSIGIDLCINGKTCRLSRILCRVTKDSTQIPCNQKRLFSHYAISYEASLQIDVEKLLGKLRCDEDEIGDLTLNIIESPKYGDIEVEELLINYSPNDPDFKGKDRIVYELVDEENGKTLPGIMHIFIRDNIKDDKDDCDKFVPKNEIRAKFERNADGIFEYQLRNVLKLCGDSVKWDSFELTKMPEYGEVKWEDGKIYYYPKMDSPEADKLTFKICNGDGKCFEMTLYIILKDRIDEDKCRIELKHAFLKLNLNEHDSVAFNVLRDNDLCEDSVVWDKFRIVDEPMHGKAEIVESSIIYTPEEGYKGEDKLTYEICYKNGECKTGSLEIYVFKREKECKLNLEDKVAKLNLKESHLLKFDILEFNRLCKDSINWEEFKVVDEPANGDVEIKDGTILYEPAEGFTGEDYFTYQVCYQNGDCQVGKIKILVYDGRPDEECKFELMPISMEVSPWRNPYGEINLIKRLRVCNDSINWESLKITSEPAHGEIKILEGVIFYKPESGFSGEDYFKYELCLKNGECKEGEVKVKVDRHWEDRDCLMLEDMVLNWKINREKEIQEIVYDILEYNKVCKDSVDWSTLEITQKPEQGEVSVEAHKLIYITKSDSTFLDKFGFKLCLKDGNCKEVFIKVFGRLGEPDDCIFIPKDDEFVVTYKKGSEPEQQKFDVLKNDRLCDVDVDFEISVEPGHGKAVVEDGVIYYLPKEGFEGVDKLAYKICLTDGRCKEARLYIKVKQE